MQMANIRVHLQTSIPSELADTRLDQALAKLFPQYSRAQLQQWIRAGAVSIDGHQQSSPRRKVVSNQKINIDARLVKAQPWQAQALPINVIYEDEDVLIINKPAGLVVHPGAGVPANTLVNALLNHAPELTTVPRAGIVHRLDKDTSGLLVVARNLRSHHALIRQMQQRTVKREYQAIVQGIVIAGGRIEANIGRHPTIRTRMAVVANGRAAITHYRVIKRFRAHTHLRVILETGRTHQIRVHLAHIRCPLVGDPTYGKSSSSLSRNFTAPLQVALHAFRRQALHAAKLALIHPVSGQTVSWEAPLPQPMLELLQLLQGDADATSR